MRLDDRLMDFFQRPLMCIIASADRTGQPAAGRGVGFELLDDRETIDVIFSGWQWPRMEQSIRETGKFTATFVSPSDYVTFQLKGSATMRGTEASDIPHADHFIAAATAALCSLGVPPHMIASWLTVRDARVVRLSVREVYVQTPGPLAGMLTDVVSP
ncbi:pyridoxamine 5'-phosphate oxidase family protein [Fuscibacter oryzae]|uniref:Pyridoxamine 5'-phosphate oxidase family protein n=1 Tax=Fuscibacter oryzae TaxID=2803939 RepID=A0A8J7MQC3_9RHOB|nr:pyridoxamine 5'-phosphate oxidase family protein [Fuscibacter oryzae]MBL4928512.1 pyridoxamine 5'-phosphate oxidase family protein [Fuscibacter oryzae]